MLLGNINSEGIQSQEPGKKEAAFSCRHIEKKEGKNRRYQPEGERGEVFALPRGGKKGKRKAWLAPARVFLLV